jgi:hypothetical protein
MPILKVIGRGAEHRLSVALRRVRSYRIEAREKLAGGSLRFVEKGTDPFVKLRA